MKIKNMKRNLVNAACIATAACYRRLHIGRMRKFCFLYNCK